MKSRFRGHLNRCLGQVLAMGIVLVAGGCIKGSLLAQAGSRAAASVSSAADESMATGAGALRAGDLARAVAAFTAATQQRPQFAEAYLDLGLALEQSMAYPEAVTALEKARHLKPTLRGANLFLGIAEYQMNELAQAEEALKREIKLSPQDAKALMWLGVVQVASDQPVKAVASLDAAAILAPQDPDILYHRGRAHLLVSKASYEEMFRLAPDSYRVHEVLGQADAEAERTLDAIVEYKLAIERAPRHAGLHEELGDLYWASGSTELADKAYEQELALDPYSFPSTYKLGALRVIVGKADGGLPLLERAQKLDPNFETTYYYLGRAQVDAGQTDAGIANLVRASKAQGDSTLNTLAFYQLSRAYRRLHRTGDADTALAQFRALRAQKDETQAAKRAARIESHRLLPAEEKIPGDEAVQP